MPDFVRVNDTIYSWNSTLHKFDNQPWEGILEVNWEQKIDAKTIYAARPDRLPLGSTTGKWSLEGFTMKMLRDSADAFTDYLCTKLGNKRFYGRARFDYLLQISEPMPGLRPISTSIQTCRVLGQKNAHAEGTDELVTEFTLLGLFLTENGKALWSNAT
jgi:hypothetical protein